MNEIQLVTITWRGVAFFRYATPCDPGAASFEAGRIMDSLADRYGNGFGYEVAAAPYISRTPSSPDGLALACDAYETGAWPVQLGS